MHLKNIGIIFLLLLLCSLVIADNLAGIKITSAPEQNKNTSDSVPLTVTVTNHSSSSVDVAYSVKRIDPFGRIEYIYPASSSPSPSPFSVPASNTVQRTFTDTTLDSLANGIYTYTAQIISLGRPDSETQDNSSSASVLVHTGSKTVIPEISPVFSVLCALLVIGIVARR